jgi:hypothetical protein
MTRAVSNSAAPRAGANHPAPSSSPAPGRWGNPDSVAEHGQVDAVASYCQYLAQHPGLVDAARHELAGAIQSLY